MIYSKEVTDLRRKVRDTLWSANVVNADKIVEGMDVFNIMQTNNDHLMRFWTNALEWVKRFVSDKSNQIELLYDEYIRASETMRDIVDLEIYVQRHTQIEGAYKTAMWSLLRAHKFEMTM